MTSSAAAWARVFSGLRLVASSVAARTSESAGDLASSVARHGAEVAANARTGAAATASWSSGASVAAETAIGVDFDGESSREALTRYPPRPISSQLASASSGAGSSFATNGVVVPRSPGQELMARHGGDRDRSTSSFADDKGPASDLRNRETEKELSESVVSAERAEQQAVHDFASRTNLANSERPERLPRNHLKKMEDVDLHDHFHDEAPLLKEGRPVPSTRIGRALGFASLGVGLAAGTAAELASRVLLGSGGQDDSKKRSDEGRITQRDENNPHPHSPVASDANADRLAASLCRMRGAALKLGQMLSIQDESMLPPALSRALRQVRRGAEAMPARQLREQLESQLGLNWRDRLVTFDDLPFAAASIGQVHRATLRSNNVNDHESGSGLQGRGKRVVMKVQYPGVANSIDSDLSNLQMLVTMTGLAPPGLFIDNVIRVGRDELKVECDYIREMKNQQRFKALVEADPVLTAERFVVPGVIEEMTTEQVLTTEYAPGGTIDKVSSLDQDECNRIARNILRLTIRELFCWRFMQTDPNWGNFLYDVGTGTTYLIDFGAARQYDKSFVDGYLRIVWANANRDTETLMAESMRLGFLTGEENHAMLEAHRLSGFTVGEPFASHEPYDFRGSKITARISEHSSAFLQHRLTPPPEEVYTLHRKLAGAYNLCIKLGAVIPCRDLLEEVMESRKFEHDHSCLTSTAFDSNEVINTQMQA